MARPRKQTVDYFPHYVKGSRTLSIIKSRFKTEGYTFWFTLLTIVADSEGHYYDTRNPLNWQFLISETMVSEDTATEILNLFAELEAIDSDLWKEKIIWVQHLVDNLADVYKKRGTPLPTKPVSGPRNPTSPNISVPETTTIPPISVPETLQRRGENRRGENRREYSPLSSEMVLAKKLKALILQNNPNAKTPDSLQRWCHEISLLLNKNGYTPDKIEQVIEFSQSSDFWKSNILSTSKLREKFDTLYLQSQEKKNGSGQKEKSTAPPLQDPMKGVTLES